MPELSVQLKRASTSDWLECSLAHFDSFLIDHASCERKASATAMMFVVRFPDRSELVECMIQLAREELMHFHQVWRLCHREGLSLAADSKNDYINSLLKLERHGRDQNLMDRLLIFGVVEARGCERFRLIGENHPDKSLSDFYLSLAAAEERHHELFTEMACRYFPKEEVAMRLDEILNHESQILEALPARAAVH
jgi:tRNA-(ms[2]io[6]A)-hydroxylase